MAHFYGDMQGSRGQATRCGTKQSGIHAHIRGWHTGVQTVVWHTSMALTWFGFTGPAAHRVPAAPR
jgi:hypothetical protein